MQPFNKKTIKTYGELLTLDIINENSIYVILMYIKDNHTTIYGKEYVSSRFIKYLFSRLENFKKNYTGKNHNESFINDFEFIKDYTFNAMYTILYNRLINKSYEGKGILPSILYIHIDQMYKSIVEVNSGHIEKIFNCMTLSISARKYFDVKKLLLFIEKNSNYSNVSIIYKDLPKFKE